MNCSLWSIMNGNSEEPCWVAGEPEPCRASRERDFRAGGPCTTAVIWSSCSHNLESSALRLNAESEQEKIH
jgi:hypothetical protein